MTTLSHMSRPRTHEDSLRERLLDEATNLIAQGGAQALSLRTLVTTCDTSTTAVYRLFGGRPQLLEAVLLRAAEEFTKTQRDTPAPEDAEEALMELAWAYRAWALNNPHRFLVLFGQAIPDAETLTKAVCHARAPLLERAEQAVEQGRLNGPAEQLAAALWSSVHGCTLLQLSGALPDQDELFETVTRSAIRGWRP